MYAHPSIKVPIRPAASHNHIPGRSLTLLALAAVLVGSATTLTGFDLAWPNHSDQGGSPVPMVQYLPEPDPQPGPSPVPHPEPSR